MSNIILNRPKTHLCIGDSHAVPEHNNKRYKLLGKLINDVSPDIVIDIGDWFDMPSLNSYDKGAKKAYEGRQYLKDINAGLEAQDILLTEIRTRKKKLPRFVRTLGNHEHRINRAIELDPVLEGTIGLKDLQSKEYGWEEYPFLEPVEIDGVIYSHYFVTGISGRPIGGEHHAASLLTKQFKSSTQGHSHLLDYTIRTDANGKRLHGLVAGCFVDDNLDWAESTAHLWNSGICICHNVEDGNYDFQWVSLKSLIREYGK